MSKLTIVAAAISENYITLYDTEGKNHYFKMDSPEAKYITNEVLPELAQHKKAIFDDERKQSSIFQKFSDDELRFYYMCKNVVKTMEESGNLFQAVQESENLFNEPAEDTSVVAVTKDGAVAGVEQLKKYFQYSAQNEDFEGTKNLIKRVAALATKRLYSANDLIRFLADADLPLTPEGDIIAYKMLNRKGNKYVDVASGNVLQQVGSIVCMDEALVDPDRHNDCSQGLHIASRSYLQYFYGEVCVLVRIHPEDVIAVPAENSNKVRVCKYQILYELPDSCYNLIKENRPITEDPEGENILKNAFNHIYDKCVDLVKITAPMGGGLIITPFDVKHRTFTRKVTKVNTLDSVKQLESSTSKEALAVATLYSSPRKTIKEALQNNTMTPELAKVAEEWRKKSKKSWKALGFNDTEIICIAQMLH